MSKTEGTGIHTIFGAALVKILSHLSWRDLATAALVNKVELLNIRSLTLLDEIA